jgi:hypothetical protein
MAKKDAASKRLAEETIRANVRYTINLRRAFGDFLRALKHAYGQPARDEADKRLQDNLALQAVARLLNRMGPDGDLAHFADQFAKLAQMLQDVNEGVHVPMLYPAAAKRSDQTRVWIARAYVALAVETLGLCGYDRKPAAKWAAKRHPGLKQLITERAGRRSGKLETVIKSWCDDFSRHKIRNDTAARVYSISLSHKIRNDTAARVYSISLDRLKAWAPNCNSDQLQDEADRLLQEALALLRLNR